MKKVLYIAETDGGGTIECVWVSRPAGRYPTLYDPARHRFDPADPAEFSGSTKSAISSWLATCQSDRE